MKPVTLWYREVKKWEFNHLEDGHSHRDCPHAKFDSQKQWAKETWKREFGYLDENGKVKVIENALPEKREDAS